MISSLHGKLLESRPSQAVICCGGVGYEVTTTKAAEKILENKEVALITREITREDSRTLYGFGNADERSLFDLLVGKVSGVGPKLAIKILDSFGADNFKRLVVEANINALAAGKGIGRKTAEKIIVELRDKVGITDAWNPLKQTEENITLGALLALGEKRTEAMKALESAKKKLGEAGSEALLREALLSLR